MKINENSHRILWIIVALVFLLSYGNTNGADAAIPTNVMDMSIEQLMQIEVPSTATLTDTKARLVPAAVTTITEEQIQSASARSLFELLDIYVPNLQWMRNHWEADNIGLRGIMNDRDDKYLILVNGRVMNEKTHYGALTERDLPMMKDIHHIDVVRGPGSGLYGPGAIAMVINLVTHNANTFQGTDVTVRGGAVEEFGTIEIRHGKKFDADSGIFAYFGIGKYNGADKYDAPQVYGYDFPDESYFSWWDLNWGSMPGPDYLPQDEIERGEPATSMLTNNDGESYRNLPPIKAYAELTVDDWTFWTRYTRGGQQFVPATGLISRVPWGWYDYTMYDWGTGEATPVQPFGYGYQQLTFFVGRKIELDAQTGLDTALSYDILEADRYLQNDSSDMSREDKYYGKIILNREVNKDHKLAVGTEILRYNSDMENLPKWSTNLYSFLFEHQWTINDQWTSFIGARIDDHTFTDSMFSPRAALVFTPSEKDTFKLMWARSVRSNYEEEMHRTGDPTSNPEKLDSLELRYERQQSKNFDLAATTFLHYNLQRITWSNSAPAVVGTQKQWGIELEAFFHNDTTRLGISHGFTSLIDMEIDDTTEFADIQISGKPYDYGDKFARWSEHITKIQGQYKLDDKWTLDGSMRIYWGFPGMKDYDQYVASRTDYPLYDSGWSKAYRGSYFLNLGLQYQPNQNMVFRVDGYNLLGIFNKDLNKRNYGGPDYRNHAAAVGVSMTYKF